MTNRQPGWLCLVALLASGCATITAGGDGRQRIAFATDPPGATATAGAERCTTPCSLALPRRDDATVLLAGDGRAPQEVRLRSRLRGAAAANIIFLPALPAPPLFLGIDLASGAAWELVPPWVQVSLQPADPAAPGTPRPPLTLAPRPKQLATFSLELGLASACGTTLGGLGGVLTVPVGGPFVVGAEAFGGENWSGSTTRGGGVYGLLGGVEAAGDSARAALLVRLAIGNGSPSETAQITTVTLPQVALRGEVSLLAADWFLLGLWGTAGVELGERTFANPSGSSTRVGGKVFGAGLFLGFAVHRGAPATAAATSPAGQP